MKTVVLDGHAVNPGDLSWDWLAETGEYTVYDQTLREEIIERAINADHIITNKVVFDKEIFDKLPNLKYIGLTATGFNIIDTEYAAEKGVVVTNVPAYSTESVAQHTFALMLELMTRPALHDESVKEGKWANNSYFCYWLTPQIEISGKTLGIIGGGQIGMRVVKIAKAFGMKTLVYGKTMKPGRSTLEEVLQKSDIISIHCPMNKDTDKLICKETIAKMRDGVYIINTARGGIINEEELAIALREGKVAGFAADVISSEPPQNTNPLILAPNTIITPHLAWATHEARSRLMDGVRNNLLGFISGNVQNKVN
ncbi:MAG: D-2-hydroxyacid dehydrogenase [Ruminococcaceae bacterium]|nr:D-2-hydroxyacid dehydrogenase [Oscillospiraceae bacterium]